MKIQIDTKALEALFPEGSEARVDLQNAVIANFAKKMQERHLGEEVRQEISRGIRDAGVSFDAYSICRDMLNKTITNTGWSDADARLKNNTALASSIRAYAAQQDLILSKSMDMYARDLIEKYLGKREEAGKQFVEQYTKMAEASIAKAKAQALGEIESRIIAMCKQSMPEIIRREMANYLNKTSEL